MRRQRELTPEEQTAMQDRVLRRYKSDWPDVAPLLAAPSDSKLWYSTLAAHDRAHENTNIEWWYVNGHVSEDVSFFAAFFRLFTVNAKTLKSEADATEAERAAALNSHRAHAVNWALIDRRAGTYRTFSYLDAETFDIMDSLHDLEVYQGDKHVVRAMGELFKKRRMLAPDRIMTSEAKCSTERLDIDMEGCTFTSRPAADGDMMEYVLHLQGVEDATGEPATLDAVLRPSKQPVLHGTDGVVAMEQQFNSDDMFYYFIPRCNVTGSMSVKGAAPTAFTGVGWIDHEFGGAVGCTREEVEFAHVRPVRERQGMELIWEWAAIQLDNDAEVSLTLLLHPETRAILQRFAVVRIGSGAGYRLEGDAVEFGAVEGRTWKSPVTSAEFPLAWSASLTLRDGTKVQLALEAKLHNQEFVTLAAKPSFWEGHVAVSGTWGAAAVRGDGFMECRAAQHPEAIDALFDMMRTMLFAPLEATLPMFPAEAASPATYEPSVAPTVMMASMMAAGNGVPITPAHTGFLTALMAAYVCVRKQGVAKRGRALDYLDEAWVKLLASMERVQLGDVMLRAFSMRIMDDVLKLAPPAPPSSAVAAPSAAAAAATAVKAPSAAGAADPIARFAALAGYPLREFVTFNSEGGAASKTAPTKEELQALREASAGSWVLDKARSELLGDFLASQNVNMVVRALVNRLTPRLEFVIEEPEEAAAGEAPVLITKIRTAMSNDVLRVKIGEASTYFSSGRGNLTPLTLLQDGGRTVYSRTPIPCGPRALEHKWVRFEGVQPTPDGGAKATITEFYRFDPDGVLSAKSTYAGRVFVPVDN